MGEEKTRAVKKEEGSSAKDIFKTVAVTAFIFGAVSIFGGLANVNGESMTNTLQPNDKLLYQKVGFTPKYGDILVVKSDKASNQLIKRVIGCPGDTIDIDFDNGIVYLNGEALDEPYTRTPTNERESEEIVYPLTVPEYSVFVMGDNRNHSMDSRQIGCISYKEIKGKVLYRISPSFTNLTSKE